MSSQVILCRNHLMSKSDVETTMTHELIHAYDYCRSKGTLDFSDCQSHACTEVGQGTEIEGLKGSWTALRDQQRSLAAHLLDAP